MDELDYCPPVSRGYTSLDWAAMGFIVGVLMTAVTAWYVLGG